MSDYLIEMAEFMERKYPDVGLDFDQWQKLIVCSPGDISDAIQKVYKREVALEVSNGDLSEEVMKYERD